MAEHRKVKTIIETPIRRWKPRKRWITAQSRHSNKTQELQNSNVEAAYHRLIAAVKKLYIQPGETYFDRDYKTDHEDGFLGMHGFLTQSFYWRLDCSFCYDFEITFAFGNCPYEEQVRRMLRAYPFDTHAKEIAVKPNFDTFYQTVLKVQDSQHLHSLKGN